MQASIIHGLSTMIFADSGRMHQKIQRGNERLETNKCPSYFQNMEINWV